MLPRLRMPRMKRKRDGAAHEDTGPAAPEVMEQCGKDVVNGGVSDRIVTGTGNVGAGRDISHLAKNAELGPVLARATDQDDAGVRMPGVAAAAETILPEAPSEAPFLRDDGSSGGLSVVAQTAEHSYSNPQRTTKRLRDQSVDLSHGAPLHDAVVVDDEAVLDMFLICTQFPEWEQPGNLRPFLQSAASVKGIDCTFDDRWMSEFLRRHPEVEGDWKKEEKERRSAAKWSPRLCGSYVDLLSLMEKRNYFADPQRVMYADLSPLLVGEEPVRASFEPGGAPHEISVLSFGAASGGVLKPLLVANQQVINTEEWVVLMNEEEALCERVPRKKPLRAAKKTTEDDETTDVPSNVLNAYVVNELVPYLHSVTVNDNHKALLFLDRSLLHLTTSSLMRIAVENDVMITALPPGRKMVLKPWDAYAFTEMRWNQRLSFRAEVLSVDMLRKNGFARHLWEVAVQCFYDRSFPKEFNRLGLVPFSASVEKICGEPDQVEDLARSFHQDVYDHIPWLKEVQGKLMRRFGVTAEEAGTGIQAVMDGVYGAWLVSLIEMGVGFNYSVLRCFGSESPSCGNVEPSPVTHAVIDGPLH